MKLARKIFMNTIAAFSSVVKNTSCSRGWLRLVIQSIFAVITSASFVLIVIMAVKEPLAQPTPTPTPMPVVPPKCIVHNCKVVCTEAPFNGMHEDDILYSVAHAESKCDRVVLELNNPSFENKTLPNNWLSRLQPHIYQLSIIGGNLNRLSSTSFMSQFASSIEILSLQDLYIMTWETNSLVGLSSLRTLNIFNCKIDDFQVDSIRAVNDTLETLSITESGYWDPENVTGSTSFKKLTIVNFSYNNFDKILGKHSFNGLEQCKILYLSYCGIVSIGAGAFDNLKSIEVLYLDFNQLVTLPPGLFDSIVLLDNPRPRISLQENFWHCDCYMNDLRQLVRKEILLVEGICRYPSCMEGKTFTELEESCVNETNDLSSGLLYNINKGAHAASNDSNVHVNGTCKKNSKNLNMLQLISPQINNKCSLNNTKSIDFSFLNKTNGIESLVKEWVKFSFHLITPKYSAINLAAAETKEYGLLWFQSDCPKELYCIDFMPTFLRIYNINEKSKFTFCPLNLRTGDIENDACINYTVDDLPVITTYKRTVLIWLGLCLAGLVCICFGAIIVYGLIRMYPTLLKGSKRILFVKHKMVDALVLPPKVPLRKDLINDTALGFKDKEIFTLFANDKLNLPKMDRMKSMRSVKSNSPSYISAVQPSEEQLAEWRISQHFNNDLTVSSKSELSTLSWIYSDTPYYSLDEIDMTYESLK